MRLLIICYAVLCTSQVLAAPSLVVDQEFPAWDGVSYFLDYAGDYMAQTFTANHSGTLAVVGVRVGLSGSRFDDPPEDGLLMRVVKTDESGAPDIDQTLASRRYEWYQIPELSTSEVRYVNFDVRDWNIAVVAGDILAITLSSNQAAFDDAGNWRNDGRSNYDWSTTLTDVHPGGDFYLYSPKLFGPEPHKWTSRWTNPNNPPFPSPHRDMGFRVVIAIPEPHTLTQCAWAILWPVVVHRRKRHLS